MTPAVRALEVAGIAFEVVAYDHDPETSAYGDEAVAALGLDPMQVFKTLVVVANEELLCAVVPVGGRLDLRRLAQQASVKKAAMADGDQAERRTGYVLGGISPFGQRNRHRTFVDETALMFDTVYASAGRRGLEIAVSPDAFTAVLDATFADIATD